jgi:hypothetical protein
MTQKRVQYNLCEEEFNAASAEISLSLNEITNRLFGFGWSDLTLEQRETLLGGNRYTPSPTGFAFPEVDYPTSVK